MSRWPSLDEVWMGARLLRRLPGFLRGPVTVGEARATMRHRFEHRTTNFLAFVRRAIYARDQSPYFALLRHAGCEYGDLDRLVHREGIEGALALLVRRGVYLTVEESQGRIPVVRGSTTLHLRPDDLLNPLAHPRLLLRTGGTRGPGRRVPLDLAYIRDTCVNRCLVLDALKGFGWTPAVWMVPGSAALLQILRTAGLGARPVRWFTQVDPRAPGLDPLYRRSTRLLVAGSRMARRPLPEPEWAPLAAPLAVASWMSDVLRAGGVPHLITFPSSAVRLCEAARDAGIDLRGAQVTTASEPLTPARQAALRAEGLVARARYGSVEAGSIGDACLTPAGADDLHVFHDLYALAQPGDAPSVPMPEGALLITALQPTAPLVLLNLSLGDQAVLGPRACGCPLERLGWTTHLSAIRSFEKLTAGGMTFLDADLVRVLEEVLPARFGGGPADYQLVEDETEGGRPRLYLRINPRVGPVDTGAVAEVFLTAIAEGPGAARVMSLAWRGADVISVERRSPEATVGGKVQHLHVGRRADHD